MGGHDNCCVRGCIQRRDLPTKKQLEDSRLSFYKIPTEPQERVSQWKQAIGQHVIRKSWKICGGHFVTGKPSNKTSDVDYLPTLNLPQGPPTMKHLLTDYRPGNEGVTTIASRANVTTTDHVVSTSGLSNGHRPMESASLVTVSSSDLLGVQPPSNQQFTLPNGNLKLGANTTKIKGEICNFCGKLFRFPSKLRAHLLSHEGRVSNPVTCSLCGKSLSSKGALKTHKADVHEGKKNFVCDYCGKKFAGSTGLKWHVASHTGDKPYSCSGCEQAFSRQSCLWNHELRAHNKSHSHASVSCEICGMKFLMESRLKTHMDKHNKEGYSCTMCLKVFLHRSNLQAHVKGMHNLSDKYACQYCNKRFGNSYNLKVHVRIHTGEKPYRCSLCNKIFADVCNFRRHEQRCKVSSTAPKVPVVEFSPVSEAVKDAHIASMESSDIMQMRDAVKDAHIASMESSDIMQMRALYSTADCS